MAMVPSERIGSSDASAIPIICSGDAGDVREISSADDVEAQEISSPNLGAMVRPHSVASTDSDTQQAGREAIGPPAILSPQDRLAKRLRSRGGVSSAPSASSARSPFAQWKQEQQIVGLTHEARDIFAEGALAHASQPIDDSGGLSGWRNAAG